MTTATQTNAAESRIGFYYVSLPYFGHKVLKCQGIAPDQKHMDFYIPYFTQHGPSVNTDEKNGPFEVVVLPSRVADRITKNGDGEWIPYAD